MWPAHHYLPHPYHQDYNKLGLGHVARLPQLSTPAHHRDYNKVGWNLAVLDVIYILIRQKIYADLDLHLYYWINILLLEH